VVHHNEAASDPNMQIISGMHRSGTSTIARLFLEAGADLGDPENFYPPDKWNPEGYYEQPDIHAINMPLINGIWWKFAYFRLPSTKTIMRRAPKFEHQIKKASKEYDDKVIKETRFCLTLPAWLEYGANVERIIICMRDPIEVAWSIKKRNRVTLNHGYRLWQIHNERILQHAGDIPLWFAYYNNLLSEETYEPELRAMLGFFGIHCEDLKSLWQSCVKPGMNHNQMAQPDYPESVAQLWDTLRKCHANQFTS
jgi:hypothetical protein